MSAWDCDRRFWVPLESKSKSRTTVLQEVAEQRCLASWPPSLSGPYQRHVKTKPTRKAPASHPSFQYRGVDALSSRRRLRVVPEPLPQARAFVGVC